MTKILHVYFTNVEITHSNGIQDSFFSLKYNHNLFFTSVFSHSSLNLNDQAILPLDQGLPQSLSLLRWQNSMIVFSFDLQLSQLKSRSHIRKRIETKSNQFLNIHLLICQDNDIFRYPNYYQSITAHFLIIKDIIVSQKNIKRVSNHPNYFQIVCQNKTFVIPVREAIIMVPLPQKFTINRYINNIYVGKSEIIQHQQKMKSQIIISKDGKAIQTIKLKYEYLINLHKTNKDSHLFIRTYQVLIYDIQLKIDNPSQLSTAKIKIIHSNKSFQFTQDIDQTKRTKIKKIVYFIAKSDIQQFDVIIQKNNKITSVIRVNTSQLKHNQLNIVKKKIIDASNPNKSYGLLIFKAQIGINVSIPQSNKYWRQVLKKRSNQTSIMVSLHQISSYFSQNQDINLVAKVEGQQKTIKSITNINFYNQQDEPSQSIIDFSLKGQQSLYLVTKSQSDKNNDFAGIGVVDTSQLRLGSNLCEVGIFKNQQKKGTINCMINKMLFYPFVKPVYQPQILPIQTNIKTISIFLNKIALTPYFFTYSYDSKQQLYCIVQVDKIKKVLILEHAIHQPLNFLPAQGSDSLQFQISNTQFIKIRLTFLVSDLGFSQQIYAITNIKVFTNDIQKQTLKFKNINFVNDYDVPLGSISLQVSQLVTKPKVAAQPEAATSRNIDDLSQASFQINSNYLIKGSPNRRYSGSHINKQLPSHDFLKKNTNHHVKNFQSVKLPVIKQKKINQKQSFKDLFHLMVRKRGVGGNYEKTTKDKQYHEVKKQRHSFDLKKLQQSNPNIQRNLQILFPKKNNQRYIQDQRQAKTKRQDYQKRLMNLKSVMNQINDIGLVQPTVRQSLPQEAEWDGNQFVGQPQNTMKY